MVVGLSVVNCLFVVPCCSSLCVVCSLLLSVADVRCLLIVSYCRCSALSFVVVRC